RCTDIYEFLKKWYVCLQRPPVLDDVNSVPHHPEAPEEHNRLFSRRRLSGDSWNDRLQRADSNRPLMHSDHWSLTTSSGFTQLHGLNLFGMRSYRSGTILGWPDQTDSEYRFCMAVILGNVGPDDPEVREAILLEQDTQF
ncbi:unnamed protein product, partial [Nesidiocoris tenuis]